MKTLVTGGCGYLGERLAARLLEEGHEVLVLDAAEGVTRQDKRIARLALDEGKGLIILINKMLRKIDFHKLILIYCNILNLFSQRRSIF